MCTPYSETKQGFEIQFQTNFLAHFLLTRLLLPTILSTAKSSPRGTVRIVNVSSDGHSKLAPKEGIIFEDRCRAKEVSPWTRYGMSKLANILHTKELAKRYGRTGGVLAICLHPGTVKTYVCPWLRMIFQQLDPLHFIPRRTADTSNRNLSERPRTSTPLYRLIQPLVELGAPGPEKGAWPLLWCAASPDLKAEDNGSYYLPIGKKVHASKNAEDTILAATLWEWTEKELENAGI